MGWDEGVVEIDRSSIITPFELVTFPLTPDDSSGLLQHSILNGDTPALALEVSSATKSGCPPSIEDTLQILKTRPGIMSDAVRSYIEKMRLVVTIKQEIQLIALSVKNEELESYIEPLESMLVAVEDEASVERSRCLHGSHELHAIDEILISCKIHDSSTGLLLSQQDTSARHGDILALRKKAAKLATMDAQSTGKARTSKLDQINEWLFNNLQNSSDNAALHRSMLPDGQILDEKSWARSVIKYWSIDEAAMGEEYLSSSSRGAVGSWSGSCEIPLQIESDQRGGTSLPYLIKSVSIAHAVICISSTYAVPEKAPRISLSRRAMEHLKALQQHFEI